MNRIIFLIFAIVFCLPVTAGDDISNHGEDSAKHQNDYQMRRDSINALMAQYKRIGDEKGLQQSALDLERDVQLIMKLAEQEAGLGHFRNARKIIDEAYSQVQQAVVSARNGDELVMSLEFETPADEYAYYRVKIESQLKAIRLFLPRLASEHKRRNLERLLSVASQDVEAARLLAAESRYEPALPLMERALNRLRSGLMMVAS